MSLEVHDRASLHRHCRRPPIRRIAGVPKSVTKIYAGMNFIQEVADNAFVHTPQLLHLYLSYNQLRTVKKATFNYIMQIQGLRLEGATHCSRRGGLGVHAG